MKHYSKCLVLCIVLGTISACGKDQAVMVGSPSEKGLIKESIDEAKNVGTKATEREQANEKDLYGG